MDKDTTPTPDTRPGAKYRGAVVEDLQLPPAFCLEGDAPLSHALEAAYEREFDQLPILSEKRRPIGYLNVRVMKEKFARREVEAHEPIHQHTIHFPLKSKSHPYTIITPLTPLEDLEAFFQTSHAEFALVSDEDRKFIFAVVTKSDLETFVKRRG